MRAERVGAPVDASAGERASVAASAHPLSEYLQLGAGGETQCTWCGTTVAPPGADWKEHATLRRIPLERAGAHREPSGEYVLIEACCSSCGTLLDTDVAMGDDPPLHDRVQPASA